MPLAVWDRAVAYTVEHGRVCFFLIFIYDSFIDVLCRFLSGGAAAAEPAAEPPLVLEEQPHMYAADSSQLSPDIPCQMSPRSFSNMFNNVSLALRRTTARSPVTVLLLLLLRLHRSPATATAPLAWLPRCWGPPRQIRRAGANPSPLLAHGITLPSYICSIHTLPCNAHIFPCECPHTAL